MTPRSFLDNDLYKFTMGLAIWQLFPDARAKYIFTDRAKLTSYTPAFVGRLREKLQLFKDRCLTEDEAAWLHQTCSYLPNRYLAWLHKFRFIPDDVKIWVEDGQLHVEIEGPWCETVFWEVPLMATISELYYELIDPLHEGAGISLPTAIAAHAKAVKLAAAKVAFADFGTRRRRSFETQGTVVKALAAHGGDTFMGTSNVFFAKQFGLQPIGTMAHEWVMGVGAMRGLRYANRHAMDAWHEVFRHRLGTMLTDTYGTAAFLRDFDEEHMSKFHTVRQDSGDPEEFIRKIREHYQKTQVPYGTRKIIFSDSLNVDKAIALHKTCELVGIKSAFGIGTHFTNDDPDSKPLNIVIKLHELDGIPLAKLSDDPGKATGHPSAIKEAKYVFLGEAL